MMNDKNIANEIINCTKLAITALYKKVNWEENLDSCNIKGITSSAVESMGKKATLSGQKEEGKNSQSFEKIGSWRARISPSKVRAKTV